MDSDSQLLGGGWGGGGGWPSLFQASGPLDVLVIDSLFSPWVDKRQQQK